MPKLLSRSKNEEFKSNLTLQIKIIRKEEQNVKKNTTTGKLLLRALCIMQPPVLLHFTHLLFLLQFLVFLLSTLVLVTYVWIVWYFTWFVRLHKPFDIHCRETIFFAVNKIRAPFSRFSVFSHFLFLSWFPNTLQG